MNSYKEKFIKKIILNSVSKIWSTAVYEWEIIGWFEDYHMNSSCICGKEKIKYLYKIKNKNNKNILFPIGSKCINKFERNDLDEIVSEKETLFKLLEKVKNNEFLILKESGFTKKILKYFYEQNVFLPNKFNKYNAENDYNFLLKMFNKRRAPTKNEEAKIRALIFLNIKPYLIKELDNLVNK